MSIEISFDNHSDERVVATLREMSPRLHAALEKRMKEITFMLRDKIVALKLSGQVLRTRTGTLRRSITARVEAEGDVITGIVGVGSKAWYGKLHEYGGTFQVPTHARLLTRRQRGKRKKQESGSTSVRAHTVYFKERSFMRSTLRENQGTIRSMLEAAIKEVVNE